MIRTAALVGVLAMLVIEPAPATAAAPLSSDTAKDRYAASLGIEPRQQWNANYGYCGETSFISAGMHFGQYASQWTVRALASGDVPQTREDSQLLLGVNDLQAAKRMRLDAVAYQASPLATGKASTRGFLGWVKSMALKGYPTIMGVFLNMRSSGGRLPGDPDYDHIVPVLGISSTAPLTPKAGRYRPSDVIAFSDNSGGVESSIHHSTFAAFPRSRAQANRDDAPTYSLPLGVLDHATAVIGIQDPDRVTIPIRLTSTADGEGLHDEPWLDAPPAPSPMSITATVTIPDPSVAYRVYVYDDFAKVPIRDFNAAAAGAVLSWTIPPGSGPTWTQTISLTSDQSRIFRGVPASAP